MSIRSGYQIPVASSSSYGSQQHQQQNQQQVFGSRPTTGGNDNKTSVPEMIRQWTTKVEDIMDSISGPIKPYVIVSLVFLFSC